MGFVFEEKDYMILGCTELIRLIFFVLKGVICISYFRIKVICSEMSL